MNRTINSVGVIGAGTMGAGIAGVCAAAGLDVHLLDLTEEAATKAVERLQGGRNPAITGDAAAKITCGAIDADLARLAESDWICEVIIEDLAAKRALFERVEAIRKTGSIVTSNTSGIPLRDIYHDMPERFKQDVAVTHFFNPVHIMRLLELVPGEHTDPDVMTSLAAFFGNTLNKGVVYAKDTVNFIGNRIGCFWILAGLHKGLAAQKNGLSMETIDTLMSKPMGLPPTGLYGLVDLIGLDIMDSVAKNLRVNLPDGDRGFDYIDFPAAETAMIASGQLGRKTGGGYYKLIKHDDGTKTMMVFDLVNQDWRESAPASLDEELTDFKTLLQSDTPEGQFAWDLMSETFCYAANLVPTIADDIVNVDRAMRWGFNWAQGPFELIDAMGADAFAKKLTSEGRDVPAMVAVLQKSGHSSFYKEGQYLTTEGNYQAIPAE